LKDYATSDCLSSEKTTQAGVHCCYADKTTQTDLEAADESHNFQAETKMEASPCNPYDQCFQPLAVKTEPPIPEEPVQGAPIPVYVSGMNTTAVRSTDYFPVNGIEATQYYEMSQEFVPINTDNLFHCPIISNDTPYPVNCNGGLAKTFTSEQRINEEEPYEWSVIEEQTRLNIKRNVASTKTLLSVRELSNMQQTEDISNGMLCNDKVSELDLDECPRMSIDDRISSVLRKGAHCFLSDEQLRHDETVTEDDRDPSIWTVEKCHQQKLLRAKILETCFDVRKRGRMRLRFLELFGSDSEECFDVDEHVTNFKDRIARWVVESLMPYYRDGRIQSRPLFKFLARHIADTLLLKNHAPGKQWLQ
jgi:hypothetical protein